MGYTRNECGSDGDGDGNNEKECGDEREGKEMTRRSGEMKYVNLI